MLKQRDDEDHGLSLQKFAEYNKQLFYDNTITEDIHQPLDNPQQAYIT
jgi:hypothetical protein